MNQLFDISNGRQEQQDSILLCEFGETYTCLATIGEDSKVFDQIQYYTYEPQAAQQSIAELLTKELDGKAFNKKVFCSHFADAFLVPQSMANEQINILFPNSQNATILQDAIGEWQMVNVYILPNAIYNTLQSAQSKFLHGYTPLLKVYNGFVSDHQVLLQFSTQQFSVLVKKDGQIMLAQTYSFTAPLDVVYYLLSIYQQFDLSKSETYLVLSGLIEEDSALYREMVNYFQNIYFDTASAYTVEANFPKHYFTSLFNLASCAL